MSKEIKSFDVVIIGGGVAGCAAAIWLARLNRRVLLIEKEPAAHHKVCGEFISIETIQYLTELGLDLTALGAAQISSVRLVRGDKIVAAALPFKAASLSRFILDEALLKTAVAAGVQIRRGVAVTDLIFSSAGWTITCTDNDFLIVPTVFLATGKHNVRHWPRIGGKQNDLIGFKMHYRLTLEQQTDLDNNVEIILFDGGYAGLEPIENGLANLCLVIKKSHYHNFEKSWLKLLEHIAASSSHFSKRLQGGIACWKRPLAIFGIPYGFVFDNKQQGNSGLYRLGDQMAVIPSFSGDGMAIALYTASLAVAHYRCKQSQTYHQQARRELLPQIYFASFISRLFVRPSSQKIIQRICQWLPTLMIMVASNTRLSRKINR